MRKYLLFLLLASFVGAHSVQTVNLDVSGSTASLSGTLSFVPQYNSLIEPIQLPKCNSLWAFSDNSGKLNYEEINGTNVIYFNDLIKAGKERLVTARCDNAAILKQTDSGYKISLVFTTLEGSRISLNFPTNVRILWVAVGGATHSRTANNFDIIASNGTVSLQTEFSAEKIPEATATASQPKQKIVQLPSADERTIAVSVIAIILIVLVIIFSRKKPKTKSKKKQKGSFKYPLILLSILALSLFAFSNPVPSLGQLRAGDFLNVSDYSLKLVSVNAPSGFNVGNNTASFELSYKGMKINSYSIHEKDSLEVFNPLNSQLVKTDLVSAASPVGAAARKASYANVQIMVENDLAQELGLVKLTESQKVSATNLANTIKPSGNYDLKVSPSGFSASNAPLFTEILFVSNTDLIKAIINLSNNSVVTSWTEPKNSLIEVVQ